MRFFFKSDICRHEYNNTIWIWIILSSTVNLVCRCGQVGEIWLILYLIRIIQRQCFTCRWVDVDKTEEKWERVCSSTSCFYVSINTWHDRDQLRIFSHLSSHRSGREQYSKNRHLQASSESLVLPVSEGGAAGIHILVQRWGSGLVSAHFITRSQNPVVEVVRLVSIDVMSRPADGLQRASRGGHFKRGRNKWLNNNEINTLPYIYTIWAGIMSRLMQVFWSHDITSESDVSSGRIQTDSLQQILNCLPPKYFSRFDSVCWQSMFWV